MSKMAELHMEINDALVSGYNPRLIASVLNIPLDWVLAEEANLLMSHPVDLDTYDEQVSYG
jgi:hypothetical protein